MSAQFDRILIAADKDVRAAPFDLPAALSGHAIGWAKRHGALMGALYLLEIDLRYGDVASAQDRIAKALEMDAANA